MFDLNSDSNIKEVEGLNGTVIMFTDDFKVKIIKNSWSKYSAYLLFFFIYHDSDLPEDELLNKYLLIYNTIDEGIYIEYPISLEVYETYIDSSIHLISPYKPDSWYL